MIFKVVIVTTDGVVHTIADTRGVKCRWRFRGSIKVTSTLNTSYFPKSQVQSWTLRK